MKIGVFDSGLGGLYILSALREELPEYDYLYYGDTKHVPYGDRPEDEIYELTKKAVEHLFENDCSIVVIACNTVSAASLVRLQEEFLPEYPGRKIVGVIIPTIEHVVSSGVKDVLLIGTKRTVDSGKYDRKITEYDPSINLLQIATPSLVPFIESGEIKEALEEAVLILKDKTGESEGLILGCTHYVVLKEGLRKEFPSMQIFSQDEIIPKKFKEYLSNHPEIEKDLTRGGGQELFFTGKGY